jgi:hypothetical protein
MQVGKTHTSVTSRDLRIGSRNYHADWPKTISVKSRDLNIYYCSNKETVKDSSYRLLKNLPL